MRWVIVDEIHALAPTSAAPMALSLGARCAHPEPPQRIGLSATQRRSRWSPGSSAAGPAAGEAQGSPRPVTIVDAGVRKPLALEVVVPVEDMGRLGETIPLEELPGGPAAAGGSGPASAPRCTPILELIRSHRSTIVFANNRRLAERRRSSSTSSRRRTGPGAPRVAGARATAAHRADAQGGPPARHRRHELARAGHRHGRGGPGHPGGVAAVGGPRAPADRPRGTPGGGAQQGVLFPSTGATCSRPRS